MTPAFKRVGSNGLLTFKKKKKFIGKLKLYI